MCVSVCLCVRVCLCLSVCVSVLVMGWGDIRDIRVKDSGNRNYSIVSIILSKLE